MSLQTGQVLNNRYRIVKLLGEGGFGAVYRAWDTNFNLPCALKENTETSEQAKRQFQREAKILHTLRHPNLPLVKDYFSIPDQGQYLVMDYVEGDDLLEIMKGRTEPLPEPQVRGWLTEICDALKYLHSQNPPVIHRDIKPANIKITPGGNAILVDFGIFKLFDPDLPTTQGARAVTPGYSPFEQYGHAPTDARTDIYALGSTVYALLTGKTPPESISRMAGSVLESPRQLNPSISPEMEAMILKAMEVMPEDRYSSISGLMLDLSKASPQKLQSVTSPGKIEAASVEEDHVKPTKTDIELVGATEPETPVISEAPLAPPLPADRETSKRSRSWRKIAVIVFALFAIVCVIIGGIALLGGGTSESSPPEESDRLNLTGEWGGTAEMHEWGSHREAVMRLEHDPDLDHFFGELEIYHPNGENEKRGLEGEIDVSGNSIIFVDSANWFYWGWLEGDIIGGELSLDCMHCEVHGGFEFRRR